MKILRVNTARVEKREINGRLVATAIGKRPRQGAVAYGPLGLEGDKQVDLTVHGGLSKAIYRAAAGFERTTIPAIAARRTQFASARTRST